MVGITSDQVLFVRADDRLFVRLDLQTTEGDVVVSGHRLRISSFTSKYGSSPSSQISRKLLSDRQFVGSYHCDTWIYFGWHAWEAKKAISTLFEEEMKESDEKSDFEEYKKERD